jgi:hypothetical protein
VFLKNGREIFGVRGGSSDQLERPSEKQIFEQADDASAFALRASADKSLIRPTGITPAVRPSP